MLRDHTPDIIFLDHIMPGLDGFQVLQKIKGDRATRRIPVVMYTSQAAPQYTSEARSLGAIGVISKQVSDEMLVSMLEKAELYRLEAVNEDSHDEDVELVNNTVPVTLVEEPTSQMAMEPDGVGPISQALTSRPLAHANAPANNHPAGRSMQEPLTKSPFRDFAIAAMLLIMLGSQFLWILRDQHQQGMITDMEERIGRQQEEMTLIREELLSEQQRLSQATWRQVQFIADVLVAQTQAPVSAE